MQSPHCKLKEVVWEITNQCHQNCQYCGSKDILNTTEIQPSHIRKIADDIVSARPEEVNISGGNPLLVSYQLHEYITSNFKRAGIKSKIIVNPFNIPKESPTESALLLYDWIGISVNTKAELERFKELPKSKTTVITNFNTQNIFLFKEIERVVLPLNIIWQIQYTMYRGDSEYAIYQNKEAKTYLDSLISGSKANIIVADNMNKGGCTAGLHSIGILANGDVVPCLSMRSWDDDVAYKGNIIKESLEHIWTDGFAKFRCKGFICCKDITQGDEKAAEDIQPSSTAKWDELVAKYPADISKSKGPAFPNNITMVYGVATEPYRPRDPQPWNTNTVMAYAVFTNTVGSASLFDGSTFQKPE